MMLWLEIRRRVRAMIGPLVISSVAAYFAYHATYGDRGFFAAVRLGDEIAEAREVRDRIAERKNLLEARVALLKPESLDPDMLEERARFLLEVGRPDELVILDRPATHFRERPVRVTSPRQ